ncbi:MAG TPA: DEAD/DEAH box helicase [Terriglobia bacterium]|nr:DEAD/DEAH box helicase [Terriglobia bacterium]
MQSFTELPISQYTQDQLAGAKFSVPTPVQAAAIPVALEGKDVLATAQTGTGKTLAFLIPIMERLLQKDPAAPPVHGITALVLVPTRELAMQVVEHYNVLRGKRLMPAALVVGGLSEGEQLSALRRGARLVVATPGRLEDFLNRKLVNFRSLQVLILDEADRMLDMGFLPSIRRIAATLPKDRQTMCFSATLEASVAHLVNDYMRSPVRLAFGSTLRHSENVRVQAFEVSTERKQEVLQRLLDKEDGRCLVFARTKRGTERLARTLTREGFAATMIHGDRSQSQRTAALAGFQQGRFRVLVATDLASRGIHVQDIAHVINYDMPQDAESFIHRVGRTGRAGGRGVASTFFAREQRSDLFQLERTLGVRMERIGGNGEPSESIEPAPVQDRSRARTPNSRAIYSKPSRPGTQPQANYSRHNNRAETAPAARMARLPGEVLQVQN